ncbi:MAG: UDP-2,4-diacetamido-2,4,6-trideoxy-beta-L-altropyranose hydrolase [Sulfuritalea sp.]|nr:UDP-2,4-diacetamido-2,4,6-trideoxy-beta-L-altropyranose hydrolase [Sulfuritalea sp.]
MKIVFRTDASSTIGTGHVMRCLALAQGIRRAGDKAVFVCRELPGHFCDEIAARGFEVLRLSVDPAGASSAGDGGPPHAAWLGTSWQNDAEQTRAALSIQGPVDWLVVDHYALDARWESAMRPAVQQLMVIDDMFDRPHDADLLLNQNVLPGMVPSYAGLVPAACSLLLGPRYALLQACYREIRSRMPPRSGNIKRVLVYFGGVDAPNLTGRSLEALLAVGCGDLGIDVVLPVVGPNKESVRSLAGLLPGARVHQGLPTLAELMATADLAIGAGGSTSWERLCVGLPSLVVTLSENQRMVAQGLQMNELALWLGHHDEVSVATLVDALHRLLTQGLAPGWLERCRAVVDGGGTARVVNALLPESELSMRPAELADANLIYRWRNDPVTRRYFFDPRPIELAVHEAWYASVLAAPESVLLIGQEHGQPIGAIRFDIVGDEADVSVYLAPDERGRGLGHRLIYFGGRWLFRQRPTVRLLNAHIHPKNLASQTAFTAAGFIEHARHYRLKSQNSA